MDVDTGTAGVAAPAGTTETPVTTDAPETKAPATESAPEGTTEEVNTEVEEAGKEPTGTEKALLDTKRALTEKAMALSDAEKRIIEQEATMKAMVAVDNPFTAEMLGEMRELLPAIEARFKEYGDPADETALKQLTAVTKMAESFAFLHDRVSGLANGMTLQKLAGEDAPQILLSDEFRGFVAALPRDMHAIYEKGSPEGRAYLVNQYKASLGEERTAAMKEKVAAEAKAKQAATKAPGKAPSAPTGEPVFTESQIAKMTPAQYAANRTKILAAEQAGRIRPG